jgi:molecular chaperone GrpE
MSNDEDLQFESSEEELGEGKVLGDVKKLRARIKELEAKSAEYLAGWQRAKADYVNLKREEEDNKKELIQWAQKPILLDLIRLADTFELAFSHQESWQAVPDNWRLGVEHIYKELVNTFTDYKLEPIEPLQAPFNPAEHESVGTLETTNAKEDNMVVQVIKKGYRLNGQVIRPAQVKVGTLKA